MAVALKKIKSALGSIENTTPQFRGKLVAISQRLGMDPNWISAVMAFESGYNPQARNPLGSATGLIQWISSTAKNEFGLTVDQIYQMDAMQQLDLVYQFFAKYNGRLKSLQDTYFAVFCPNLIGKPLDTVVGRSGDSGPSPCYSSLDTVYAQNKGFDHAGVGYYTAAQVAGGPAALYASATETIDYDENYSSSGGSSATTLLVVGGAIAAYWWYRRRKCSKKVRSV
jgi:hypothetical protein